MAGQARLVYDQGLMRQLCLRLFACLLVCLLIRYGAKILGTVPARLGSSNIPSAYEISIHLDFSDLYSPQVLLSIFLSFFLAALIHIDFSGTFPFTISFAAFPFEVQGNTSMKMQLLRNMTMASIHQRLHIYWVPRLGALQTYYFREHKSRSFLLFFLHSAFFQTSYPLRHVMPAHAAIPSLTSSHRLQFKPDTF